MVSKPIVPKIRDTSRIVAVTGWRRPIRTGRGGRVRSTRSRRLLSIDAPCSAALRLCSADSIRAFASFTAAP